MKLLLSSAAVASIALSACMRLPSRETPVELVLPDASLASTDASVRPPTGAPYTGPSCQEGATPGTSSALDAGVDGSGAAPAGAGGAAGSTPQVSTPSEASAVVITELMVNPALVRDDDGEWIELHNPSPDRAVDLAGCALDDGAATRPIGEPLLLAPLGYATLARSAAAGFTPDRTLGFSLANEVDAVTLSCAGLVIDRVAYDGAFPLAAGVSMSLDPRAFDAARNDDPAAWCLAPSSTYAERGTPGAENAACNGDPDAGS